MTDSRRDLPSVNRLLETSGVKSRLEQDPRGVGLDAVRTTVEAARSAGGAQRTEQQWVDTITSAVHDATRPSLRRVINATGVILHTNLGRAPLADVAIRAIEHVAEGFSNLEYDIDTGQRGSRYSHCVGLLRQLSGAEHGLPVIHDLGSGLLLSLEEYGLSGEPTASTAIASGPTLVLMSGDKLLGGPQAGVILGKAAVVAKLRKNPFARAMRVDKLTLSALEATLRLYLEPAQALKEIPVLAMLTESLEEIELRAH